MLPMLSYKRSRLTQKERNNSSEMILAATQFNNMLFFSFLTHRQLFLFNR